MSESTRTWYINRQLTISRNARPLRTIADPLQRAIIQHSESAVEIAARLSSITIALNTKDQIYLEDASTDPRFSAEASQTPQRSVICIPIFGNRGQTFGVIYFSSKYPFSKNTLTILTLLCQQASVSISNALLFKSVQAGTRENLKMIAAQRDALEAARRSREDALKATKVRNSSADPQIPSLFTARSKATFWLR